MPLINLENISKVYGSDGVSTHALHSVSFKINPGEFVAIMGHSGCGKSTLLHILGMLDRPSDGNYLFEDTDTKGYTDQELAKLRNKKLGFVFQAFFLLSRTSVLDNVKLPLLYSAVHESEWETKAMEAINSVGLSHRISHRPSQLSGGEKQRVAIARALVNNPTMICADEPTGNLDSGSAGHIIELFSGFHKQGKTIIVVTHEAYVAQNAERIIYLEDGHLKHDLSQKEFFSSKKILFMK